MTSSFLPSRTALWRGVLAAGVTVALAACNAGNHAAAPAASAASASANNSTAAAPPASSAASAPSTAASTAQEQPDTAAKNFKAYGFSPAWQAEVRNCSLSFDVPETTGVDKPLRSIKTECGEINAEGITFKGQDGKVAVTLEVRSGPCEKATQGDGPREFHAKLTYGKQTYQGCADAVR